MLINDIWGMVRFDMNIRMWRDKVRALYDYSDNNKVNYYTAGTIVS